MSMESLITLAGLFFIVALLYSSVGFGGGSSYLALLTFFLTDQHLIRGNALVCNIAVVAVGCWIAYKDGSLILKRALTYALLSIPAAFAGAMVILSDQVFFITLACLLILSSVGLLAQTFARKGDLLRHPKKGIRWLMGAVIGYLSGMVGIGGGIFLSPIVNLLRWEKAREMAGIASFFILVNSISGIIGLATVNALVVDLKLTSILVVAVLAGGCVGGKLKSSSFKSTHIRILTAALVLFVGLKLLIKYV